MIYTVTLNPAIDYTVWLNRSLTSGAINRTAREALRFGGKGINVSCVLRELGCRSAALGFTAGFTGEALERGLEAAGLAVDFVRVSRGMTRINVKVSADEETEINGSGPEITADDMEELFRRLEKIADGDTLVLSGSIPPCLPQDTYAAILERISDRQIRVAVDTAGEGLIRTLAYRPFLIKPNIHELGDMLGTCPSSDEEIVSCALRLQEKGAQNVLVSMGGDGALLLDETGALHRARAHAGTVVSSVGAGDSMVAGFLAGFLESGDYEYALRLGCAAGSASAFCAGLARREDIERLMLPRR
ncbi:MAG: 1-phosphofructokinase [Lachnospiraceae bacterium]|nr:1-phosphofructokinase [Lachnospiraceae bacterium]